MVQADNKVKKSEKQESIKYKFKMPTIPYFTKKFGVGALLSKFNEKTFSICGLDTETIGADNPYRTVKDLHSIQIVKNDINNSYIEFPENQGIEILDYKHTNPIININYGTIKDSFLFPRRAYISCHNLQFDLGAILGDDFVKISNREGFDKDRKFKGWKVMLNSKGSCYAEFKRKDAHLIFVDSMAFFSGSLEKVAQNFFPTARKMEKPSFLGVRLPNPDEQEYFNEYAMNDAKVQFLLTQKIVDIHRQAGIPLSITPASMAIKIFLTNYLPMSKRIFLDRQHSVIEFCQKSYAGARFEAIGRGRFHHINYYDINSSYPYSAIKTPLPFSNKPLKEIDISMYEKDYCGVAKVEFQAPESEICPILPVRSEKLLFPLHGISYCTSHELVEAIRRGYKINPIKCLGWYPTEEDINHPLGKYMADTYAEKQFVDEELKNPNIEETYKYELLIKRQRLKLILNATIGKFDQKNENKITKELRAGKMFNPIHASLILGYSRYYLNKIVHDNKVRPLYFDTDSIMTPDNLPTSTELGGLKLESGDVDLVIIRSKNYFIFDKDGKVKKCATHSLKITQDDNNKNRMHVNQFMDLLKENPEESQVEYKSRHLTKPLEAFRRKLAPRAFIDEIRRYTIEEDGKRNYHKKLSTIKDLLTDSTLSSPLDYAENLIDYEMPEKPKLETIESIKEKAKVI
jgi:hypothetical protein